jgi:hypothetical protein
VVHVGDARPDGIKRLERAYQSAGGKDFDVDPSPRRIADRPRETNRAGLIAWRSFQSVGHHLELPDSLRDGGSRETRACTGSQ